MVRGDLERRHLPQRSPSYRPSLAHHRTNPTQNMGKGKGLHNVFNAVVNKL